MAREVDLGEYRAWATYDLLDPGERARVAEFIVGKALHSLGMGRQPTRPYSLETSEGCRIDVRSAARLQSWGWRREGKPPPVMFNIAGASQWWDHGLGCYVDDVRARWSHVHVCALLDHADRGTVNPARVRQWRFWVLPTDIITADIGMGRAVVSLARLERLGAVEGSWHDIPHLVRQAWQQAAGQPMAQPVG